MKSATYQKRLSALCLKSLMDGFHKGEGFTWETCEKHIRLVLEFFKTEVDFSHLGRRSEDVEGDEATITIITFDCDNWEFLTDAWKEQTTNMSELMIAQLRRRSFRPSGSLAKQVALNRASIERSLDLVDAWAKGRRK